jgi:hypothetical protein
VGVNANRTGSLFFCAQYRFRLQSYEKLLIFANFYRFFSDCRPLTADYKKKEGLPPGNPISINLKSNTMKNTMQKYNNLRIYANYLAKNMFYSIKFAIFVICTYH